MPTLNEDKQSRLVKGFLYADSGMGKTGSLASLVKAGYTLHVADYDNGLAYLSTLLTEEEKKRVNFQYFGHSDLFKKRGVEDPMDKDKSWKNGLNWIDETYKNLGDKDVLVVDSITMLAQSCINFVSELVQKPRTSIYAIYNPAGHLFRDLFSSFRSEDVKCHVLLLSHVRSVEDQTTSALFRFPEVLGRQLPSQAGAYFNTLLSIKKRGSGDREKREIITTDMSNLMLKSPMKNMPTSFPLETGLADYFRCITEGKVPDEFLADKTKE